MRHISTNSGFFRFTIFTVTFVFALALITPFAAFADRGNPWDSGTTPEDYYVVVTSQDGSLNVRSGPSTDYDINTVLQNREVVHVTASYSGNDNGNHLWLHLESPEGWVSAALVTVDDGRPLPAFMTPKPTATVTVTQSAAPTPSEQTTTSSPSATPSASETSATPTASETSATPTTSATQASPTEQAQHSNDTLIRVLIIGIVVGVVLIALVLLYLLFIRKKQTEQS